MVIPSDRLLPANSCLQERYSYRKQIARQHSWSIFLTSSLITMQNLVAVSHTVCTDVGGPKFFSDAGPRPLWTGHGWPPRNRLLCHMCYYTKFCRCRSNRLGVDRGPRKFGGRCDLVPLGIWVWLSPRNILLPTCYVTKFRHSRSNHFSVGRGSQKYWGRLGPAPRDEDVVDPLKIYFCPHLLSRQIRSFQVKPFERKYGDPPENSDPSRPPPFKVI